MLKRAIQKSMSLDCCGRSPYSCRCSTHAQEVYLDVIMDLRIMLKTRPDLAIALEEYIEHLREEHPDAV